MNNNEMTAVPASSIRYLFIKSKQTKWGVADKKEHSILTLIQN